MNTPHLSVIIPCFNEERNIRLGALENVAHFLEKKSYLYEVIIVDDGSKDESIKLIGKIIKDHKNFRIIANKHQGKAATVMTGIAKASGKYVLFTDLDQATPINQMDKLIKYFNDGFDVVIGSRSTNRRGAPILRRTMARGFMIFRNIILNLGIEDTQCGFKMFTKKSADNIFGRLKVFTNNNEVSGSTVTAGFDVELLFIAKSLGYKIKEVPVDWYYQETRRVNPIKDSFEGLMDLFKIRLNSMKGIYKT